MFSLHLATQGAVNDFSPFVFLLLPFFQLRQAFALACSAVSTAPSEPGTTGTPALCISFRAAALLPMARITSPEGPMKVMPAASQASASRRSH